MGRTPLAIVARGSQWRCSRPRPSRSRPRPLGNPARLAPKLRAPHAWFDAYIAAAVDAPRVCRSLFSPPLAATYRHTAAGPCERYFRDLEATAVRIQKVVQTDATAVVEVRPVRGSLRWSAVLARHAGGRRALALIIGR